MYSVNDNSLCDNVVSLNLGKEYGRKCSCHFESVNVNDDNSKHYFLADIQQAVLSLFFKCVGVQCIHYVKIDSLVK